MTVVQAVISTSAVAALPRQTSCGRPGAGALAGGVGSVSALCSEVRTLCGCSKFSTATLLALGLAEKLPGSAKAAAETANSVATANAPRKLVFFASTWTGQQKVTRTVPPLVETANPFLIRRAWEL